MRVCVVAGGVGAARFLTGLLEVVPAPDVTAVVNVGDDAELHGLHVSPDLDTVTYTLAGAIDPERGWGLAGESWAVMGALGRYPTDTWFQLGDRDLATHLFRTERLRAGVPLSQVTAEVAAAWGLGLQLLPVTDQPLRTRVTVAGGTELAFQEYFVRERHAVAATAVRFEGAEASRPAPGVLDALTGADVVVVAPSNPIVSVAPVLAVPGVREALAARRERVVAVSPIVGGRALKGPAARLMAELGHEPTVVGVARLHHDVAATLVIDDVDAPLAPSVEAEGLRCVVAPTVMSAPGVAASLARTCLAVVDPGSAA